MVYKDIRLTKEGGFFNLKGYFEYAKIDLTKDYFLMINCERNTGKSYSSWNYVMDDIVEKSGTKNRFIYMRNTMEQIKHSTRDFNARYKDKYRISGTMIYKLVWGFKVDKNGDDVGERIVVDKLEVGVIAAISTGLTIKSGTFNNYTTMFYDEYNDNLIVERVYERLIQIMKTVKRFTSPFGVILIGNKENANNEFMVKFGVTRAPNAFEDYIVYPIKGNSNTVFIDVGFNTYAHLKEKKDIVNQLAALDERSNRYLNEAGYISDFSDDVVNFRNTVEPYLGKPIALLFRMDRIYISGFFENNAKLYIHEISHRDAINMERLRLPNIIASFEDSVSAVTKSGVTNKSDISAYAMMLYRANQIGNLYYTSFDTKQFLMFFIARMLERGSRK